MAPPPHPVDNAANLFWNRGDRFLGLGLGEGDTLPALPCEIVTGGAEDAAGQGIAVPGTVADGRFRTVTPGSAIGHAWRQPDFAPQIGPGFSLAAGLRVLRNDSVSDRFLMSAEDGAGGGTPWYFTHRNSSIADGKAYTFQIGASSCQLAYEGDDDTAWWLACTPATVGSGEVVSLLNSDGDESTSTASTAWLSDRLISYSARRAGAAATVLTGDVVFFAVFATDVRGEPWYSDLLEWMDAETGITRPDRVGFRTRAQDAAIRQITAPASQFHRVRVNRAELRRERRAARRTRRARPGRP